MYFSFILNLIFLLPEFRLWHRKILLDKHVKLNKLLKMEKSDMQKRVLVTNTERLAKKEIKNIQNIEEIWRSNMREEERPET